MAVTSPGPDLCTEEEVTRLVHEFYAQVRLDPALGPIFESAVHDWPGHLAQLVDFWSAILRRTARFSGAPMPKHAALPGLSLELFERWLGLFEVTLAEQPNRAMADQAWLAARRIARSLWSGYQMSRDPKALPTVVSHV